MPKLTVTEVGSFDVPDNKRLVLALEDEAGIDQMHTCVAKFLPAANCGKATSYDL